MAFSRHDKSDIRSVVRPVMLGSVSDVIIGGITGGAGHVANVPTVRVIIQTKIANFILKNNMFTNCFQLTNDKINSIESFMNFIRQFVRLLFLNFLRID